MKITDKRSQTTTFDNIQNGEIFLDEDSDITLKIAPISKTDGTIANVTWLSCKGECGFISSNAIVTKINTELIIT